MPSWRGANGLYVARKLGLTTGHVLCLDAGDAASLPSSPTKWLDLAAGGYDFHLGADNTHPGADEPTANGTPGRLSSGEYLGFDGADFLTYDAANEAWMTALHQAGAVFTILMWFYYVSGAVTPYSLAGTNGATTGNTGFNFSIIETTGNVAIRVRNAGGAVLTTASALGASMRDNAWNLVGVSLDAAVGANGGFLFANGASSLFNSTYASPSAGAATRVLQIGAWGNGVSPLPNGSRLATCNAWQGTRLSVGECRAFWNATRGRFGA